MDELAAAAAVVTMSIDDKAEEELGQRGSCVTVGACDATMADVDTSAEDKGIPMAGVGPSLHPRRWVTNS